MKAVAPDDLQIGQRVRFYPVLPDNGQSVETCTRSEPWQLASGHWVVLIKGRAGGVALTHLERLE